MAQEGHRVLYISGEESSGQLALRAHRIGAVREGIEAWKGDACATSVGMLLEDEDEHPHDEHDEHEGHDGHEGHGH